MTIIAVVPDTFTNDQFVIKDKYLLEAFQQVNQDEKFCNFVDENYPWHENTTLWQTAFVQVITETVYNYKYNSFTEKIWKPMVNLRPFILVSSPGSLNELKNLGFKTFDSWWDESYDNILDPVERLYSIVDVISEISTMNKIQIQKTLYNMKSVLEHNFYHYHNEFKSHEVEKIHKQCKKNLQPR